jgi:hypothetical protein
MHVHIDVDGISHSEALIIPGPNQDPASTYLKASVCWSVGLACATQGSSRASAGRAYHHMFCISVQDPLHGSICLEALYSIHERLSEEDTNSVQELPPS